MNRAFSTDFSSPVVKRSKVPKRCRYTDYREELRFDFYYACAYCSISETEAKAIAFEIDHYIPRSANPDLLNSYSNLMWSCAHCNRRKSDFSPSEDDYAKGHYIIRIDEEDPREHLKPDSNNIDRIDWKTETGRFNVIYLELNRKSLRRLRELRRRLSKCDELVLHGLRLLNKVRIDLLKNSAARGMFIKTREDLKNGLALADDKLDDFIRKASRSPLIDPDPDSNRTASARKKYLKEIGVLLPGSRRRR